MLQINIWLSLTSCSQLQGEELFFLAGTWPGLTRHSVTGFAQARGGFLESVLHVWPCKVSHGRGRGGGSGRGMATLDRDVV